MNTKMSPHLKIGLSSAVAFGFAGITYVVLKKVMVRNAAEGLNNLTIKMITTEECCDEVVVELRQRCTLHHAIGFDCEWVTENGSRQPVALVQLSTFDGYCGLFQLSQLKSVPNSLKELLEDETIYKVGVAPIDDAKYLAQDYAVDMKATLDIRHIANLCGQDAGGLATLSKSLLGVVLDKSWRVRCSDWAAEQLTNTQIKYAAADAHVAIKIFVKLIDAYYRTPLSFLWRKTNMEHWNNINQLCWKYTDVSFKSKPGARKSGKEVKVKESRKPKETFTKRYPHATRTKPLYHNCFLQAPDGELLCTCDNKKALWYVEKELADVVKDEPLTVRLRFEPAGRSVGDVGRYYQLIKENKCVVCGASDSYIRKNVVPKEYRKYLPEVMKDHSSHDVLLLCGACHQRSNARDQAVRARLALRCHAPYLPPARAVLDDDCKRIRSAARALLHQTKKHVLPEARRKELESVLLKQYPQCEEITEELLEEASKIDIVYEESDFESHGQKVVEYFMKHDSLIHLEELWRQHFLDSMRPKYMPELWSIKHNEERLRVKLNEGRLSEEDRKLLGL